MDKDTNKPNQSNIHHFPQTDHEKSQSDDFYGKLDIDAQSLESSLKQEMKAWHDVERLRRLVRSHLLLLVSLAILIIISVIAHLWSLDILTDVRDTDPALTYEQMVEYHNAAARQMAHLGFVSKASFVIALGIAIFVAIRASIQNTWMAS